MSKETLGIVLGIVIGVMTFATWLADKNGKTTPTMTIVVLVVIAGLCLCGVYLIPWLWSAKSLVEKSWRVCSATAIVLIVVGKYGIWVWPTSSQPESRSVSEPDKTGTTKIVLRFLSGLSAPSSHPPHIPVEWVRLAVQVVNSGPPTSFYDWQATLITPDGKRYKGRPNQFTKPITIKPKSGALMEFGPEMALYEQTKKAIPTGDSAYGVLEFELETCPAVAIDLNSSLELGAKNSKGELILQATVLKDINELGAQIFPGAAEAKPQRHGTTEPPPVIVQTGPVFGNIRDRAIALADDIMRDPCMHGWTGWPKPWTCSPSASAIEQYPRVKTAEDLPRRHEWDLNRSVVFRHFSLKKVRSMRDEFSELHIRNDRLDEILRNEETSNSNSTMTVNIDVTDIQQVAESLKIMAGQVPNEKR
jgi:hypothetical protein